MCAQGAHAACYEHGVSLNLYNVLNTTVGDTRVVAAISHHNCGHKHITGAHPSSLLHYQVLLLLMIMIISSTVTDITFMFDYQSGLAITSTGLLSVEVIAEAGGATARDSFLIAAPPEI